MPHPSADALRYFLDFVEFLQQVERKHVRIAFLEIEFERSREVDQFPSIFDVMVVIIFENRIALKLSAGQMKFIRGIRGLARMSLGGLRRG